MRPQKRSSLNENIKVPKFRIDEKTLKKSRLVERKTQNETGPFDTSRFANIKISPRQTSDRWPSAWEARILITEQKLLKSGPFRMHSVVLRKKPVTLIVGHTLQCIDKLNFYKHNSVRVTP